MSEVKAEDRGLQVGQVVYITKYALTKGILTKRVSEIARSGRILVVGDDWSFYNPGREVHATIEAAQAEARAMAMARIKSLEKSVKKAEKQAAEGVKVVPLSEKA